MISMIRTSANIGVDRRRRVIEEGEWPGILSIIKTYKVIIPTSSNTMQNIVRSFLRTLEWTG